MSAGTLTLTNNSVAVAGNWTAFTTEVAAGDFIVVTVGGVPYTLPIKSVESGTALTLISNFTGPTQSGAAWSAVPRVALNMVTAALVTQSAEALRGLNYDKQNWQQIFSGAGNITVRLPDGSSFPGPSWKYLADNAAMKENGRVPISEGGTGGLLNLTSDSSVLFIDNPLGGISLFAEYNTQNYAKVWGAYNKETSQYIPLGIAQGGTGGSNPIDSRKNLQIFEGDILPSPTLGDFYNNMLAKGNGVFRNNDPLIELGQYSPTIFSRVSDVVAGITINYSNAIPVIVSNTLHGLATASGYSVNILYGTANTTVDVNGNLKRASPIVRVKGDGSAELNEEAEGITVERISTGVYKIAGILGFNSDRIWGGIDGGYVIPQNGNGLPLLWVDFTVEPNGDITLLTFHREHVNVPTFARNHIEGLNDGDPVDIPAGRWVDVRVQMPEDSIWNQKQIAIREAMERAERERQENQQEEQL